MNHQEAARELLTRLGAYTYLQTFPSGMVAIIERWLSEYEASKWVSADNPPEKGKRIISNFGDVVRYIPPSNGYPREWIDDYGEQRFGVTHWMPLPEGPKE